LSLVLIELGEGDHVVAVAKLAEKDEEEGPTSRTSSRQLASIPIP
jgi:hypothetical protein